MFVPVTHEGNGQASEEEAEILTLLGIDYGQGFFFLEPLPGQELARSPRVRLSAPAGSERLKPRGASSAAS